ncbi:MAG TPA: LysM peptidoglycan-binding domain-containing protein [Sulfurovum sp.]|nr:LysM peptidoglycan-binding domain-containing protein [Sulfurovum sp.]
MPRNYIRFFIFSCLLFETVAAKSLIDCRVITGVSTKCNPYGAKFLKAKEVVYDVGTQKLIRVKTLPVPEKKPMRVISVADMIEKYVKVEESVRFKGSESTPLEVTVIDEPLAAEKIEKKIEAIENCDTPPCIEQDVLEHTETEKPKRAEGEYVVAKGDALSRIAKKFGLKTKVLANYNNLKIKSTLRVGKKLKLPFDQKTIDAFSSGTYTVEEGDTLISIAKMFKLDPKALVKFNKIKDNTTIRKGKVLKLPLPYVLAEIKAKKKRARRSKGSSLNLAKGFGKRKLRVTATAYSSHRGQTDKTPFLAAWNNRLRPGMKIIAVSRDMLTRYGMKNGTRVRIGGLRGIYRVRDKMNKRYRKRIDIYMGVDRRRALRWGRRSVVIYW